MPQAVKNDQTNRINQNQAGIIQAINNSANPTGAASVVRQSDAAGQALAAEDAQARQTNQRYFLQENAQLGNEKEKQQQANVFDPFTRQYNEAAALRGAGMQNENTAVQDLSQLGLVGVNYAMNHPSTTSTATFGQTNGIQPIVGAPQYQAPQLTNQLPGGAGIPPNQQFNPQFGFNPYQYNGRNLYVPQFNNPYFPN